MVGTHFSPWIEKSMELDRNLQSFQQASIRAEYHPCDITVRENLAAVLESIRSGDEPIRGIINEAGIEAACRFSRTWSGRPLLLYMTARRGASHLVDTARSLEVLCRIRFDQHDNGTGGESSIP
jgi:hypothetical protein